MKYQALTPITLLALALGGIGSLAVPAAVEAQTRTLSWTETSRIEVPGALGLMLRAMPGGLDARTTTQTMHLQGRTLIQEDGNTTTIIDSENRRITTIDHEARTYMTFTFEESAQAARDMARLMTEGMAQAEGELAEARAEMDAAMEDLRREMEDARATLNFRISSERTGRTQAFSGAGTAAQHYVMGEFEATAAPEGVDEVEGGTMVFLVELWQSPDLPNADAFYEQWAANLANDPQIRALGEELQASAQSVTDASATALAMWDPRISAGLTEVAEAVGQIDGTTVRSIVTVAIVPLGVTLDRDELLAWQPAAMGDRVRAEAAGAARDAAAAAARGAVRGLTGRLGARGGRDEPEERPADQAEAMTRPLMRVTTTKEDIVHRESRDDVLAPLMRRIEGYRQVTLEDLMREAQSQ